MKAPNIIEQLYFNKIEAQERTYRPDSKCFQLLQDIDKAESKLNELLDGNEKKLFEAYCEAQSDLSSISELDSFIVGFRLGAKFILDTFCSDEAPFDSHQKK